MLFYLCEFMKPTWPSKHIKLEEILLSRELSEEHNKLLTTKNFTRHLELVKKQQETFLWFLSNIQHLALKTELVFDPDDNTSLIVISLIMDSLNKFNPVYKLTEKGYYNEAGNLVRSIFENTFQILYLVKSRSWQEWVDYHKYRDAQLKGDKQKKPKDNKFFNPSELLKEIGKQDYYDTYRLLCSYCHPSFESVKSVFGVERNTSIFYFTPRFDKVKCEFLLNLLFGLFDTSIQEGLKNLITFLGSEPKLLQDYESMRNEAEKCFDKFYT